MGKYRLLAGRHEQPNKKKPLNGPDGKPTGRFEVQRFDVGDTVESDIDLVARFGPERFQALGGQAEKDAKRIAQLEAELSTLKTQQAAQTAGGVRVPGDPPPEVLRDSPAVAPGGQVSTGFQGAAPGEKALGASGTEKSSSDTTDESDDDLESLTATELRELAADEEIELHGARSKEDLVKAVRTGRSGRSAK